MKDGKPQTAKNEADYYQLHTEAAERLVNTTAENTPHYSKQELEKYRSGKKQWKLPEALKVLLIKFWFYGAICYFVFMGFEMAGLAWWDLYFVASVVTGLVTDLLIRHFLRFTETMQGGSRRWMMVTKGGAIGFMMNIAYSFLLVFCVMNLYVLINTALQPEGAKAPMAVLTVEPLLFGLFVTALDTGFIGLKRLFLNVVEDAKEKVSKGR